MSETRKVFCKKKPDEVTAEITLPDQTTEEQWKEAMEGYYCTEHDEIPIPPKQIDISLSELIEEVNMIKKEIEDLKKNIKSTAPLR